jgi:hypothetical protein
LDVREAHDSAIGQAGNSMRDGGPGKLAFGFCLAGRSGWSCPQAPDQLGSRVAPAADMLDAALLAQLSGPVAGGQATGAHDDRPGPIDDADRIARAAPVRTAMERHGPISSGRVGPTRAGRSPAGRCSGRQEAARRTVVGFGLPAPAARRVACEPSRQVLELPNSPPLPRPASSDPEMHR